MNKFCINCKHHRRVYEGHECHHPNSAEVQINMVTGKETIKAKRCGTLRHELNIDHDFCGPVGLWYEEDN